MRVQAGRERPRGLDAVDVAAGVGDEAAADVEQTVTLVAFTPQVPKAACSGSVSHR